MVSKRHRVADPPEVQDAEAPLDERVRRSRATVLSVTAELLFEHGFSGVSVDEISRRSGVAKTTIYRHWPNRADLLRDACLTISTRQPVPDTGSFEGDVTSLLLHLAQLLRSAKWTSVLPSVIDAAERDPEIAEMHGRLQQGHTAPLQALIKRAVGRGELSRKTDPSVLIAALTGPLFYRRWFSRELLSDAFVKDIVRRVVTSTGA